MAKTRHRRSDFYSTIQRLVAKLQKKNVHTVTFSNQILRRNNLVSTFRVEALYTFGSFARGAATCGDLDLLLRVELEPGGDGWPTSSAMVRAALGNVLGIDVIADPGGSRLQEFPEAKLLWSPLHSDLARNLAAIPDDPNAGHFDRKTDRLPVSIRQLQFYRLEQVEQLVDDIDEGKFLSLWIPLDSIHVSPEQWPPEVVRLAGIWERDLGKDTRKLLPYVIQYSVARVMGRTEPTPQRHVREKTCVCISGVFSYLGRPFPAVDRLDDPRFSTVVLAPHINKRYPSGLWVLERGSNHPAIAAFSDLSVWVESEEGRPVHVSVSPQRYLNYQTIELYPTHEAVEKAINSTTWYDDDGIATDNQSTEPLELSGRALLEAISDVEGIFDPGDDYLDAEEGLLPLHKVDDCEDLAKRIRAWKESQLKSAR